MKQIIVCLVLVVMGFGAMAQTDTMFYFMNEKLEPCEKYDAYYYRIFWPEGIYYSVRDYHMVTTSLKEAGTYADSTLKIRSGMFEEYRTDKSLATKGAYGQGKKIGVWKTYHKSGAIADSCYYKNDIRCKYSYRWSEKGILIDSCKLDAEGNGYSYGLYEDGRMKYYGKIVQGDKRDSVWTFLHSNGTVRVITSFDKDSIISISCFDKSGMPETENCVAMKMPEFPGGDKGRMSYLIRTLKYPDYARENNITGRAVVRFVVNEDGSLTDVEAIKNPGGGTGEEAIRVVKQMPKWSPAVYINEPVKVYFTLPIMFSLDVSDRKK